MGSDRFRKRKQKDFFKREQKGKKRAKSSIHGEGRDKGQTEIVAPGASWELVQNKEGVE